VLEFLAVVLRLLIGLADLVVVVVLKTVECIAVG
jgi:hypothetical protein